MSNKKLLLLFFYLLAIFHSKAQQETHLIDSEAWAKGNFVEFGINSKGTFGNKGENKPSSFHDNRFSPLFGFIANPKKDNWIDFDGDYFAPGEAEEGFTLQVNNRSYSNNSRENTEEIFGEIISTGVLRASCYEDIAQIIWEGNIENLKIKRFYNLTQDGLFIQMITSIINTGSAIKNDVFFMHNVDPDNNITLSDSYETHLEIVSQPSALNNISLVKARQEPSIIAGALDTDGSVINFFSNDPRARVTFGGFSNRNAEGIWNASLSGVHGTVGRTTFGDEAMSIAFNLGDILAGEEKSFVYYYSLKEIDENFNPLIVNIITFAPSICNGNDGKIQITGLEDNENYIVSYKKDGVDFLNNAFTSDNTGKIEILNLEAGLYTNIVINSSFCISENEGEYEIEDPLAPTFLLSNEPPTNECQVDNGIIKVFGLNRNVDYLISYQLDGVISPRTSYTSNSSGEIFLSNLSNGNYTNFNVQLIASCSKTSFEVLILNNGFPVTAQDIPDQFYCDNDFDYMAGINFSNLDSIVLGSLNTNDFNITYHDSIENANNDIAISKTNYISSGNPSYSLFAKLKNKNFNCSDIKEFKINVDIPEDFSLTNNAICLLPDSSIDPLFGFPEIETGLNDLDFTINWYLDDNLLPSTSSSIEVSQSGIYKVIASKNTSGCSLTKEVNIVNSGAPRTPIVSLESVLFSNNNIILVTVTGIGTYQYKIDDGDYQDSPKFENVTPGDHIFYINDVNGCGEISIQKTIIDYPRFFTPNNDGLNPTWNIVGIEKLNKTLIQIYDRYGKLITVLNQNSIGWDGYYRGKKLPSNTYWFVLYYEDNMNRQNIFRAHFSLLRR
jgi:gliding motility-associated-like protein